MSSPNVMNLSNSCADCGYPIYAVAIPVPAGFIYTQWFSTFAYGNPDMECRFSIGGFHRPTADFLPGSTRTQPVRVVVLEREISRDSISVDPSNAVDPRGLSKG